MEIGLSNRVLQLYRVLIVFSIYLQLQDAVNTILKFLGLAADSGSGKVNQGVHTHTLLSSGECFFLSIFIGTFIFKYYNFKSLKDIRLKKREDGKINERSLRSHKESFNSNIVVINISNAHNMRFDFNSKIAHNRQNHQFNICSNLLGIILQFSICFQMKKKMSEKNHVDALTLHFTQSRCRKRSRVQYIIKWQWHKTSIERKNKTRFNK